MKISAETRFILLTLYMLPFLLTGFIVYLLFRSLIPSLNDLKKTVNRVAKSPESITEEDKLYFNNLVEFAVHFSLITWITIFVFLLA